MWKLKHVKKEHQEYYIFVGEEFTVGRKDATLLISNDPSVSRRHAVLSVKHPEGNLGDPSKKSSLFLRDEGSKYGIFKNGVRISSEVQLQNNDLVKFGQFESEFRIHYTPLVVTTSCLEVSAKKDLKKAVHFLGGSFISEWQPTSTHLVMTEVKVTVKALCCLVSAKPIVTPEYFQELKRSLKDSATLVQPNKFIPPIGEALIDKDIVSFDINPVRKTLFKNKTFFFLDEKQFKKLNLGVILGGGNASILREDEITPEILLHEGCCVIEPMKEFQPSQEVHKLLSSVKAILHKKERRMIPESDIGLSVAYCSTQKFCNPEFKMVEILQSQKMLLSQSLTQREVYVPDTQEKSERIRQTSRKPVRDALNSLHLSSFQNDQVEEMEASEIPLSAQVKQELDNIFDDPLEEEIKSPVKMDIHHTKSPSPIPERIPKREAPSISKPSEISLPEKIPRRSKRSTLHRNENILPNKVPKQEEQNMNHQKENLSVNEPVSPLRCNGVAENEVKDNANIDLTKAKKSDPPFKSVSLTQLNGFHTEEPDLPRNLAKIEFATLICRKPVVDTQKSKNASVKNFKKFKKVLPRKLQALPRIIGAHELIPYDKVAAEMANEIWDEPVEASQEVSQSVKGEFDW